MPGIKNLKNQVCVVTGAGSGIGRATALALARSGAQVVLADIQLDPIEHLATEIRATGNTCWTYSLDVAQSQQVADLATFVESQCGPTTVLFNNAGVAMAGEVIDTSLDDFAWILGINFWGPLHGIRAFLPGMIQRKKGHIVTTASFMGLCPTPGTAAYSATKAAVIALSEALRHEVHPHHVGVSVICPGIINTRVVETARYHEVPTGVSKESAVDFYRRRGWPPERVAHAVLRAIRKNQAIVPVGPEAWIPWYLKRYAPSVSEWLTRLAWSRIRGRL